MLDGRAGAGSDPLKSMHLVLLAFKSSWSQRKESGMALKLVWRLVNTVSKEGPEVYRMVSSAQRWIRESPATRATAQSQGKKNSKNSPQPTIWQTGYTKTIPNMHVVHTGLHYFKENILDSVLSTITPEQYILGEKSATQYSKRKCCSFTQLQGESFLHTISYISLYTDLHIKTILLP